MPVASSRKSTRVRLGQLLHGRLEVEWRRRDLAESRGGHLERLVRDRRVEHGLDLVADQDVAGLPEGPAARHLQLPARDVVAEEDLRRLLAGQRIGEDELVLGDEIGGRVDIQGDLLGVGHRERDDVVFAVVEAVLPQVAERAGAVQRLAQDQVGQASVELHELRLATALGPGPGRGRRGIHGPARRSSELRELP